MNEESKVAMSNFDTIISHKSIQLDKDETTWTDKEKRLWSDVINFVFKFPDHNHVFDVTERHDLHLGFSNTYGGHGKLRIENNIDGNIHAFFLTYVRPYSPLGHITLYADFSNGVRSFNFASSMLLYAFNLEYFPNVFNGKIFDTTQQEITFLSQIDYKE